MKKAVYFALFNVILLQNYIFAQDEVSLSEIYSQAIKNFQEENYSKSISLWQEILEIDPDQQPPKRMIAIARRKIKELILPMTKVAHSLVRSGKYQKARKKYIEILAFGPKQEKVREELVRLDRIMGFLNNLTQSGKVPRLLRIAVGYSVINNSGESVLDVLIYAGQIYKKEQLRPVIEKFLKLARDDYQDYYANMKFVEGLTLLEQYLEESLNYMYDSNYVGTINKCNRILVLERDDVTALMRLGSSYYALNKIDQAEKFWKKVLKIEPGNKQVKKFLKVIKKIKRKK